MKIFKELIGSLKKIEMGPRTWEASINTTTSNSNMDSYLSTVKTVIQEAQADAVSGAVAFVTAHESFASLNLTPAQVEQLTGLFNEFKGTLTAKKSKRVFKPSGYSLFSGDKRAEITAAVKAKDAEASQTLVMKAIAATWSALSAEQKAVYNDRAKAQNNTAAEASPAPKAAAPKVTASPVPAAAPAAEAAPAAKGKKAAKK